MFYTWYLLKRLPEDTTAITNTAFAICASLASVSFGCARATKISKDLARDLTESGIECFYAGLLLLIASLLKYTLLSLTQEMWFRAHDAARHFVEALLGSVATFLFFGAVIEGVFGIVKLSYLLKSEIERVSDKRWGSRRSNK